MSIKRMTTGQIGQLVEIDNARVKKGQPGIADEVAELINRLTSGGVGAKSDDPRIVQAKRLWDLGWGRELKMSSFDEYLATIPEIPERPNTNFDRLVLVDRRLPLVLASLLASLFFNGSEQTFAPSDYPELRKDKVYWMWCQVGRLHRGEKTCDVRGKLRKREIVCDAFEGVAIYTQYPDVVQCHCLDLPGSVKAENRNIVARLDYVIRPALSWGWNDTASSGLDLVTRWA